MTLYGHENTLSVTLDQMIHHCKVVRERAPNTFCIPTMPYGGFNMQGKNAEDSVQIMEDAIAIEKAGALRIEIEAVLAEVAREVDMAVSIFTFSIGGSSAENCQLLNGYDLIGGFNTFKPKFVK